MKKRILKWTVGILLAPIVLFFILAALLYVPAIQDFAVRKATAYAAEATGMDVRIGLLRLTFLFDINLQEVQVTDKEEDTLLDVEQLTVDLSFSSIFRGEIDVEGIELTQASVNTKSLIKSVAIRGHIGHFYVDSHGIKLPQETVTVSTASLSDADVDIVAEVYRGDMIAVIMGECKFSRRMCGMPEFRELERRAGMAMMGGENIEYMMFSREGFRSDLLDFAEERPDLRIRLVSLDDIGEWAGQNASGAAR